MSCSKNKSVKGQISNQGDSKSGAIAPKKTVISLPYVPLGAVIFTSSGTENDGKDESFYLLCRVDVDCNITRTDHDEAGC